MLGKNCNGRSVISLRKEDGLVVITIKNISITYVEGCRQSPCFVIKGNFKTNHSERAVNNKPVK